MIADRRSQNVLRSSAIIWKHHSAIVCDRLRSTAINCDQLRSCDHMETKVLRSAIEIYPIICRILRKQGSSVCLNRHDAAMREDGSVSKETGYGSSCPVFAIKTVNVQRIYKRRNRMGLNWEDICEDAKANILQVVTIVGS